jgi:hypothetical protein
MSRVSKPQDYHVGWICAVQTEYVVACELLDEEHPTLPSSSPHDNNTYTLGRIGHHNVVIACLPKGKYGLTSAASVATDMLRRNMISDWATWWSALLWAGQAE